MSRKEKTMDYYRGAREHHELVLSTIQAAIERSETKGDLIENLRLDMDSIDPRL